jgi:hypothetical protein
MKTNSQGVVACTCVLAAAGLLASVRGTSTAQAARAANNAAAVVAQQPLGPLLGKQVVFGVDAPPDPTERVGLLEAADPSWVRIRTRDGLQRCYPVTGMRYLFPAQEVKP